MKILIVGDPHFRYQLPYAPAMEDARRSEWEAVKKMIHDEAKKCDVTILMGDNFNSKHNHSSVNKEFIEFLNGFGEQDVYMIAGNHERYGEETALDFIKEMEIAKWKVYTNPTHVQLSSDISFQFLPFMTPGTVGASSNEEARDKVMEMLKPATYLFHHHIVESTKWEGGDSSIVNELVLPATVENNYTLVFGGHIHQPSRVTEKTWVVGNIFTNEVGEHEKFIFILDTETNTVEQKKLPCRPIYSIDVKQGVSYATDIPAYSIVKATVRDPFFVGQRNYITNELFGHVDAFVLVEQFSKQRKKVDLTETGALDLSIDNLLRVYCDQRKVSFPDIRSAFDLLDT